MSDISEKEIINLLRELKYTLDNIWKLNFKKHETKKFKIVSKDNENNKFTVCIFKSSINNKKYNINAIFEVKK